MYLQRNTGEFQFLASPKGRLSVADENWGSYIWSLEGYGQSLEFLNNISSKTKNQINPHHHHQHYWAAVWEGARQLGEAEGKAEHWIPPTSHQKTDWELNFRFHSLVWRRFDGSTVRVVKQQHRRCHYLPSVHKELLLHL